MSSSKGDLSNKLAVHDLKAFEMLYTEHYEPLCRYAQRFVFDLDTSRGIVQDVFISIWEKRRMLLDGESMKSYLYRSVHNKCLDFLKHLKVEYDYRNRWLRKYQKSGNASFNMSGEALEGLITKELEEAIYSAIQNLPKKCREVFELSRYEGKKYREISEELNISVKTVETQMSRAIKSLREQLSHLMK